MSGDYRERPGARLAGQVRHLLSFVGGLVAARGWADAATVEALVGVLVALAGTVWSYHAPEKRRW